MDIQIRKYLCGFLVAIAALGLHIDAVADSMPRRISVWTHTTVDTGEFIALNEAAKAFNRSQKTYRVDLLPAHQRKYDERVRNAALVGGLPCLLEFDGPMLASLAWPGYLQPIDRFVPRELLNDVLPSIVAQGSYKGRLYSLAQFDSGHGLWANRRYLTAAGIRIPTVEAPWSLAEFEQAMAGLTALDEVDYALNMGFHLVMTEFASYAFGPILQGFGGDLIDRGNYRSARGALDGPQSVAAVERIKYWIDQGWTLPARDRADDFENGKAALSWSGHWKYPDYLKPLGEDLILLPLPDFGHGIKAGMGSWAWGITSQCKEPEGAWAFLARLMSNREILRMTQANGAIPARRSALMRSPLHGRRGPLRVFAQQLGAGLGVPRPATPAYPAISDAFSRAINNILDGGDVRGELGKAAEAIDRDIASHRGYPAY